MVQPPLNRFSCFVTDRERPPSSSFKGSEFASKLSAMELYRKNLLLSDDHVFNSLHPTQHLLRLLSPLLCLALITFPLSTIPLGSPHSHFRWIEVCACKDYRLRVQLDAAAVAAAPLMLGTPSPRPR